MQMPGMSMPGMVPTYDAPPRSAALQSPSRAFHSPHVDLTMPMFNHSNIPSSMPFHAGGFAFDPTQQFHLQQSYSVPQQVSLAPAVTYAGPTSLPSCVPQMRDVRSVVSPVNRSPPVKPELPSPVPASHMFQDSGYIDNFKRASPTESESGITFSTDVDTLMKAIQGKSSTEEEPSQVLPRQGPTETVVVTSSAHISVQKKVEDAPDAARSQKPRRRYPCSMPGCKKSFSQKTHLEIHTRAHTGDKPFVLDPYASRYQYMDC